MAGRSGAGLYDKGGAQLTVVLEQTHVQCPRPCAASARCHGKALRVQRSHCYTTCSPTEGSTSARGQRCASTSARPPGGAAVAGRDGPLPGPSRPPREAAPPWAPPRRQERPWDRRSAPGRRPWPCGGGSSGKRCERGRRRHRPSGAETATAGLPVPPRGAWRGCRAASCRPRPCGRHRPQPGGGLGSRLGAGSPARRLVSPPRGSQRGLPQASPLRVGSGEYWLLRAWPSDAAATAPGAKAAEFLPRQNLGLN